MKGYKCTNNGLWMVNLLGWEGTRPVDEKHLPAIETIAQALPITSPNMHPLQNPMKIIFENRIIQTASSIYCFFK